jgi:peptide deformylase
MLMVSDLPHQVGLALRLFVIDTTPFSDDEELNDTEQKKALKDSKNFINAKMIKKKEKNGALMKVV